ncbi:hypothetical protein KKB10_00370 [Patescibacteria group bacterium]|nr:hypothetical protein [Patescibacteria group bacterium]MBU1075183.1 hypothetical protein [Patescibacteria group bacterium]MBU1951977.1 hypothetical protein [Patescibacteria group bacterium]MBU2229008.1 hypothetical protein [Patescibacteria group bacterium]
MEEKSSNQEKVKEKHENSEDAFLPREKAEKIDQPKKKHRLRTFFIVLVIVLVLSVIGFAATGLYDVPGISSIMGTNKPRDLGIKTSPEAVASISEKIPMKISGDYVSYTADPSEIFTGEIDVDAAFSSEEITSWLERFEGENPIFDNVQVKKGDGTMEISAMMQKYVKAPVYIKLTVDQVGVNQVSLNFVEGKFGIFNVPEKYLQQGEDFFEENVNALMNKIPGFKMEEYEIKGGNSYLKGTYPANARPTVDGWGGLFNL